MVHYPILISILLLAGPGLADPNEPNQAVPRVVVEPVEVGNPNKALQAIMNRVVRTNRADLDACLKKYPGNAGTLLLGLELEADGTATSVRAVDRGGVSPYLATCLVDKIAGWRFPTRSDGGVLRVRYPLELPLPGPSPAKPKPAVVGPKLQGALSISQIRKTITAHLADIQACWEADLRPCPALHAKVVVRIKIGPSGEVTQAELTKNTSASKPLEDCILKAIRGWRFPKPQDGAEVTITYPFVFTVP